MNRRSFSTKDQKSPQKSTMRNLLRLLLLLVPSRLISAAPPESRVLEDQEDGDNNNQDLSMYELRTGVCFRVKQESDNDDDGNSYFYNGAYRAQYSRYISYQLCSDDYGCQDYVTDLEDYLENTVSYVQNLCNTCANTCRRLRRLEDGDNNNGNYEELQVNCDTCTSDCARMSSNSGNGYDEANYLECQEGKNENDMQYYTAPQCENGEIVIGLFYDDECTIKTQTLQDEGFSLATFETIQEIAIDCSMTETCGNINDDAVYCQDGYADDQNNAKLCKAAKAASRVQTYYKKPLFKKVPIGFIVFLIFFISFVFGFLAYTYYVRHHLRHAEKKPMAELDETNLPEVS